MSFTPEQQAADETTSISQLRELAAQSTALARLVAGNFSADSELLRTLAVYDDRVVQQLVAANPNVPLDLLEKLAKQYPRQVLNNPAIDLFLLEKPDLLSKVSLNNLPVGALIKRSLVSTKFLDYAAKLSDEKVQMAIAMNPETPREILERLMKSQNVHIVEAASMHINWSKRIDANWQLIFQSTNKIMLAGKREELKTALRRCRTSELLHTESSSLGKPLTIVWKLWGVTKVIVSPSRNLLLVLVMFLFLLFGGSLIGAARISSWMICSIALLTVQVARLIGSLRKTVLYGKKRAGGSVISAHRLELSMQQAQKKLENASNLSDWIYIKDLERIACHPSVTAEMLKDLLLHKREAVRRKAVKNSKLAQFMGNVWSIETLNTFKDLGLDSIAAEIDTPTSALEKLVQCDSGAVRRAAVENPNANKQVIEQWQKSSSYRNQDLEWLLQPEIRWLQEWLELPLVTRLSILMHPEAPIGILAKAFRSDWWVERCAIAQNPSTPRSIRQRLAEDGNWVVRAAARESLERLEGRSRTFKP